jgi:hypothetical protein
MPLDSVKPYAHTTHVGSVDMRRLGLRMDAERSAPAVPIDAFVLLKFAEPEMNLPGYL